MRRTLLIIPLLLLLSTPVQAEEIIEPKLMRCTVYTAPEGALTASGSKVREGIVAAKRDWLGYTCVLYDEDMKLIGYYEVKDTGAGIDTDGDGKGDSIKKGLSIDIYRESLEACYDWVAEYGDYCYVQLLESVG